MVHFAISDSQWLGMRAPCLTHGLRGLAYFECEVAGGAKGLHLGVFGEAVHGPLLDLYHLMASLVEPPGAATAPATSADAEEGSANFEEGGSAGVEAAVKRRRRRRSRA